MQNVRANFHKEIEKYMAVCEKSTGPGKATHLPELQRLATSMVDNILQRLKNDVGQDILHGSAVHPDPVPVDKSEMGPRLAQLQAREQELEALLSQRRQEQERRQAELRGRFQSEFEGSIQGLKQELASIQDEATFGHTNSLTSAEVAELRMDLTQQEERIQQVVNETQETLRKLQGKKQQVDIIEEQQSRPTPVMENILASVHHDGEETEDEVLAEITRRGEQVCKQLRRHLAI